MADAAAQLPSEPGETTATVVIRAKNEERLLGRCLEMVYRQRVSFPFDILVIDSGSTDRTLQIARGFPAVRVHEIPPAAFNFGATLNLGVDLAGGRYIAFLSAHCVPADEEWLAGLVGPMIEDPTIVGTFGRQLPWPDCEPVERSLLEDLFPSENVTYRGADTCDGPLAAIFSNASSCVRKDVAVRFPFAAVPYSEDRIWAYEVLSAGFAIAYAGGSRVYHSHNRGVGGYFSVGRLQGQTRFRLGLPTYRLTDCAWFGPRRLYWAYSAWIAKCRRFGVRPSVASWAGAASVARIVAQNCGTWWGDRRARRAESKPVTNR